MNGSSSALIIQEHCPNCGALVTEGRSGCQALFDELSIRAFTHPAYSPARLLAFDTYCMQHVETYCLSAKSYAAHLTRLCCGLEFGGSSTVYAALQKWLNGTVEITKPQVLRLRGSITIVDASKSNNSHENQLRVNEWANSVWQVYACQQNLARTWIAVALKT